MYNAWENGISPHEFRKSSSADLVFISAFKDALNEISKNTNDEAERKRKIEAAMRKIQYGKGR